MLYCETCGQCIFISQDLFIEYANVTGTDTKYLSATTGEVVDWGNSNTDETGESTYECPHCNGDAISFNWVGGREIALRQRALYEEELKILQITSDKVFYDEKVRNSDWDLESNKEVIK